MKHKKLNTILFLSLLIISITFTSCNKQERPATAAVEEPVELEAKNEETVEEIMVEEEKPIIEADNTIISEEVFDESELGYSVNEDVVFLNEKPLPTISKVAETTRDENKTTYHFLDGAELIIQKNGDIKVNFPIGITLLVDKEYKKFETLYMNNSITNAIIYDFQTVDGLYVIDYGHDMKLYFNNEMINFKTSDLIIEAKDKTATTLYNNIILDQSPIESANVFTDKIIVKYLEGTVLTHYIDGATEFKFNSKSAIVFDEDKTKIINDSKEIVLEEELTNLEINKDTGNILVETTTDTITLEKDGEILRKNDIAPTVKEPTTEVLDETPNTFEDFSATNEPIIEEPVSNETIDESTFEDFTEEPIEDSTVEKNLSEETTDEELISEEDKSDEEFNDSLETEEFNDAEFNETFDENNQLIDDLDFEQEVLGEWDVNEDLFPYRLGVMPSFTFLQINSEASDYGLRSTAIIENEVKPGTVIGVEIGLGADHISTGYYKELVVSPTFSQEFTPAKSNIAYFYKIKFGSLIPITEEFDSEDETPYVRLGLELGANFNINENWMIRTSFEGNINYNTKLVYSENVSVGVIYKFQ